jgi:hypothetical protein
MVHTCNPNTQETEGGRSRIWDQPGIYTESTATLSYLMRPCIQERKGERETETERGEERRERKKEEEEEEEEEQAEKERVNSTLTK